MKIKKYFARRLAAAIVAIAMFTALAAPSFSYVDVLNSVLTASSSEGTKIVTTKTTIEIANGANGVDLLDYVSFLVDDTLAADPTSLIWELDDPDDAFVSSGSVYTAIADSGTATVTVKSDNPNVKELKITLKATADLTSKVTATGFKFKDSAIDLVGSFEGNDPYSDREITILPNRGLFSQAQYDAICSDAVTYFGGLVLSKPLTFTVSADSDKTKIILVLSKEQAQNVNVASSVWASDSKAVSEYSRIELNVASFAVSATKNGAKAAAKLRFVAPKNYQDIRNSGTVEIMVGEERDLSKNVKVVPTDHNSAVADWSYQTDYYDDNVPDMEYVAIEQNMIRGVKVGKLKVIVTDDSINESTTFVVNVVPFKETVVAKDTPIVRPIAPTLTVGGTFQIVLKDEVGKDAIVTYASLNPAVASVDENGLITAKALGTTKVWALADGYNKGYCTVTVERNLVPAVTPVPQTAEVALTPLF